MNIETGGIQRNTPYHTKGTPCFYLWDREEFVPRKSLIIDMVQLARVPFLNMHGSSGEDKL